MLNFQNNFFHFQLNNYYKEAVSDRTYALEIAEETLLEYKTFKELATTEDQETIDLMETFRAGFKLEILFCKFLLGTLEINKISLLQMKELVIESFRSRDHTLVLREAFERDP